LQCVAVCCSVLQCVAVCCSALQCVAVCCSVLQCVTWSKASYLGLIVKVDSPGDMDTTIFTCVWVCCSVLQCVAVRYSVLQCVAVRCSALLHCCSVLQWVGESRFPRRHGHNHSHLYISALQCVVAECCSVLQCVVAGCCSVLMKVASSGVTGKTISTCMWHMSDRQFTWVRDNILQHIAVCWWK